MRSGGKDCCLPTKTILTARSSNQEGHEVGGAVAAAVGRRGGGACSEHEGCCPPGRSSLVVSPVDQMEFWGTEVTPGKPQVSEPGDDTYVHVSQAALGPSKDGKSERVVVRVESGGKNVVLGTLSTGKVDQMTLDLIFDREFKLSHTSTSSSVFFCGYRTDKRQEYDDESDEEDEDEDDEEEDEEPVPQAVPIKENGTTSAKGAKAAKKQPKVTEQVVEAKTKKGEKKKEVPKANLVDEEAEEGEESDEDDDEDADKAMTMDFDLDDYDEEDDSEFELDDVSGSENESDEGDEDFSDDEEDSDSDGSDDSDEDDVAAELGKKRALQGSAKKSVGDGKKPRLDTPAKPGSLTAAQYWERLIVAGGKGLITSPGKKGGKGAVEAKATPLSSKKADSKAVVAKTPQKTPGKEAKVKTPKTEKCTTSGAPESAKKLGAHTCAECSRNFVTESALSQHVVAKHRK